MALKPSTSIIREGYYFLFILGFVTIGSFLKQIDLLIGLSGVLLAGMLFNWRLGIQSMKDVDFWRLPHRPIWAVRPTVFRFLIHNTRFSLSCFSLTISQKYRRRGFEKKKSWLENWLRPFRGISGNSFSFIERIDPGQRAESKHEMMFETRGHYFMENLNLSTHFPLGLIRRNLTETIDREFFVGPPIGNLGPGWLDKMLGIGAGGEDGVRLSRSGDEFFSLREWSSGDSRRMIHWRASARHDNLMVRQMQASQSRSFSLIVDLYSADFQNERTEITATQLESGNVTAADIPNWQKTLMVLATISDALFAEASDPANLMIVGDKVDSISFPCSYSQWEAWHKTLATIMPSQDPDEFLKKLDSFPGTGSTAPGLVLSGRDEGDKQVVQDQARNLQWMHPGAPELAGWLEFPTPDTKLLSKWKGVEE